MSDKKDIVWQEFAEKLVEVYRGKYSYANIIEALVLARDVFIVSLEKGIQLIKMEDKKDVQVQEEEKTDN